MEKITKQDAGLKVVGATKRQASSTLTIKALARTVRQIESLKMATPEEIKQLKSLNNTIVERWIGGNLNL